MRPHHHAQPLRIDAAGLAEPGAAIATDASILLDAAGRILAAGTRRDVDRHEAAPAARRIGRPDSVLIPGLVNAHCHLDLSHIGPQPRPASFVNFIELVRAGRATDGAAIAGSVGLGIDLSRRAGVVAVGDIAGAPKGNPSLVPYKIMRDKGLAGVSFIEFFAIGRGERAGRAAIDALLDESDASSSQPSTPRLGLQPHAPNSVSLASYRWTIERAKRSQLPVCTHLAETPEELEFIGAARGPMREFLDMIGLWDVAMLADLGHGRHPVEHLADVLLAHPFLLAHVNDAPDAAIEILARARASVAYCPRASEYFRASEAFGPHRYPDMLAAGINVCLGTDSIINLPGPDVAAHGLSILDEARLLYRRDRTPADLLLRMATVNGAAVLGLDPALFSLRTGVSPLGIVAVGVAGTPGTDPPANRVMAATGPVELLTPGTGT